MTARNTFSVAVVAAALGVLIAPAFPQNGASGMQSPLDRSMSMRHMGKGMMRGGGMTSASMMAGCAGMMQSMNNGGDGTPNSQWQKHPRWDSGD
jgi:hypothetical protein